MTTLSAQCDNLHFMGNGDHVIYLSREPVTSVLGKLYHPGYLKIPADCRGRVVFSL